MLTGPKAQLRQQVLARRDALDVAQRQSAGRALTQALLNMPALQAASCIFSFLSFGTEPDFRDALRQWLAQGKRLVAPRMVRDSRELELRLLPDVQQSLVAGTWGIEEPCAQSCPLADPLAVDVTLVPGVAFDMQGHRLGYGAGFYDRALLRLRPRAVRVAVCFDLQVVEQVPVDAHDQSVDWVLTESRLLRAPARN